MKHIDGTIINQARPVHVALFPFFVAMDDVDAWSWAPIPLYRVAVEYPGCRDSSSSTLRGIMPAQSQVRQN